jgi:hypothetical protein
MAYLFCYLKRVHRPAWVELGCPSLDMLRGQNSSDAGQMWQFLWQFVLSGDQYKVLEDVFLNRLILLIRVVFFADLAGWAGFLAIVFMIGWQQKFG